MAEYVIIGTRYASIYDNRQVSEYISYNKYCEVTLQVNECLLKDRRIQNLVKRCKMEHFGKIFIIFIYFCEKFNL